MLVHFFRFLKLIVDQHQLILALSKREIASQYIGSLLGIIWTFIQPAVMIFVFWFVFSVGFKTKPLNNVPFAVWLTAGMAPWFVFSDIVLKSSGAIVGYTHLIKKSVFPSQILPVVKVLSSMLTHTAFVLLLIILIIFQKVSIGFYSLQFFYYLFCLSVLALGIGWTVAALNVFIRDVGQIVAVIMQVGFWATPIFWDINIMPLKIQFLLKLNPVYYIVQGYRDSFIYAIPFWHRPGYTLYFWGVTLFCFLVGAVIFRKLKGQFADVL
jgi:lipopolysaccharide transport system permease protein/teichoic acid transport system permease protein